MKTELAGAAAVIVLLIGLRLRQLLVAPRPAKTALAPETPSPRARMSARQRRSGLFIIVLVGLAIEPMFCCGVVVAALMWPKLRRVVEDRRQRARITATIPDAIELLVLMIRAGLTPRQAVEASVSRAPGPVRPGFVEVERRLHRGDGLADALRSLPAVLGPSLNSVADTLAIAERHGTPISDALTQLSQDVRQQRQRSAEADARKLPVRLSFPLVFCTLPSFVLVAIAPAVLAALSSLGDNTW